MKPSSPVTHATAAVPTSAERADDGADTQALPPDNAPNVDAPLIDGPCSANARAALAAAARSDAAPGDADAFLAGLPGLLPGADDHAAATPAMTPLDTRVRLLACTEALIYRDGIAATGMDRIVKVCGVARKSIYRHFATKEALVAAALTQRDARWMAWFEGASAPDAPLAERVQAMFVLLERWFVSPAFRGCAFINVAGEAGSADDAIRQVARHHKRRLLSHLREVGLGAGLAALQADEFAHQLLILIDGAITVALLTADTGAARRASRMAAALLPA